MASPASSHPKLILVLYDVVEALERGRPEDLAADLETIEIARTITEALLAGGNRVKSIAVRTRDDIPLAVADLDPATTLVFNLCEALGGLSGNEAEVPRLLDQLGFCYSGGTAENLDLCLDKGRAKAHLLRCGIPTAPYQVFKRPDEPVTVPLPAIVKPVAEDGSLGITGDAVVADEAALRRQVAFILDTYKQPALAEWFLDGREFNISVWGNDPPQVLPVAESLFGGSDKAACQIMGFRAKWAPGSAEYDLATTICPTTLDSDLEARIRQIALDTYRATGCRDFARVDMRCKGEQPYVLEVNPNPCLATDGGFAKAARAAGYDYAQMADQIARWAWQRGKDEMARSELEVGFTRSDEADAVMAVARRVGVFNHEEIATVQELLHECLDKGGPTSGYTFLSCRSEGQLAGFACYGPRTLTQGTFDLYWIATDPEKGRKGVGGALLERTGQEVRTLGGRLIVIETSGLPEYEPARRFYETHGCQHAATISDFYKPGDDLVLYVIRL